MMIVPTITIDFIGTMSSNPGHRAYGLPWDYGYFRRHDDVLKRLPCLQLKFQSSLAIGMIADFSAQRDCTRNSHMTSDRHDDLRIPPYRQHHFLFYCFDKASSARTKQTPIFCLPAWGGADM